MARPRPGRRAGHTDDSVLGLVVLATATLAATGAWIPVALAHPPGYAGGGPVRVVLDLAAGHITWTTTCTLLLVAEAVLVAGLATGAVLAVRRWRSRRSRVDHLARRLASRRDLARLGPAGSAESARRLRPSLADEPKLTAEQTGVPIGDAIPSGMLIQQSWEDVAVDIWGPRTGKTTARAIPAIIACPGPTLVTSVKGDIVDATRDLRAQRGTVWIFDPQNLYGQPQQMWINLLRPVTTITAARRLAEHFAGATRRAGATGDDFFGPKSEELTANLLLAAAVSGRTVIDAYRWSVMPHEQEPARLLREHGYDLPADGVHGVLNLPDRTRGGIYAGAEKNLMVLTEPSVTRWVTPPTDPRIIEFDPEHFVRAPAGRADTLYLLSQGGPGSPAPLIAAASDLVLLTGERVARACPGHRLDPPMLSMLDEAANICRNQRLPDLYSYFGSQGMPIVTILQSYAQGEDVWGREGMRKLWSAANIRTYGGGVAEVDFLKMLSDLAGPDDVMIRSTSSSTTGALSTGQRSVSWQPQERPILNVAILHALPLGRMVVYSTGNPPALLRTRPWQTGPYADHIRFSLARWDTAGRYDTALHDPDQPLAPVEPLT